MIPAFSSLRLRPYETQVLLLVAFLGSLRVVIALVFDLMNPAITLMELLTDLSILLVFASVLVLGLRRGNFHSVHPIFGLLLILLLALNFVEFGGAGGISRFNYYCGFFVVILLYSGISLAVLLSIQMLLLIFLTASIFWGAAWTQSLLLHVSAHAIDFTFSVISLGILSFYLKAITINEIKKLDSSNEHLRCQVRAAKEMNARLVAQGKELTAAQQHLEGEVKRRAKTLEAQQTAIEKYIHMNTRVLQKPIQSLNNALDTFTPGDPVDTMLVVSKNELNEVFRNIKATLEAREELHRTKIKPS